MSVYVLPTLPVTGPLTALAGGAYAGATPLTVGYNEVDVVATTGNSLMLPPAVLGNTCWINNMNSGAGTSCTIFGAANPFNGNAVDGIVAHGTATPVIAGTTGVTLATGHCSMFICTTQGQWKQVGDFA